MTPAFQGEVLMRRWSDSSTQGVQITFALPDASDLEPLKAKTGKRFACVLVEIGDDEAPVETPVVAVPPDSENRKKGGQWAKLAGIWCADSDFQKWAEADSPEAAAQFIRETCAIESRAVLDHDMDALSRFNAGIRYPFMKWMEARGVKK
jgi:hypothetical protein